MVDGGVHGNAVIGPARSLFQHFIVQGVQVTGCAEHFPIFNSEGPVPGGFDDAGSGRVFEEDGCIVVDLGIEVWFDLMGNGDNGDGRLTVHQPGHEVSSIAAEVAESAAAVFDRIG